MKIVSVEDIGNDVLLVKAEITQTIEAKGWVSATTNHYDEDDYEIDDNGQHQLKKDATPRQMTRDEILAYAKSLFPSESEPVSLI